MHREPAVALAGKGYHLLLEKPMSVSEEECEDIAREDMSWRLGTAAEIERL